MPCRAGVTALLLRRPWLAGVDGLPQIEVALGLAAVGIAPLLLAESFRRLSSLAKLGFMSCALVVLTACSLVFLDLQRSGMPTQVTPPTALRRGTIARPCVALGPPAIDRAWQRNLGPPRARSRRRGT
jgi:hypothetical protein